MHLRQLCVILNATVSFILIVKHLNRVDSCEPKIHQCVKNHRHSRLCSNVVTRRVRNREPSRVPLKKVMQSLKCKKLRQTRKEMLKKTVPVSSVLRSIAAHYKLWKTRFISQEDSFYTYYFKSTKKSKMICNSSERNILLSGDVELNPGPATAENTSAVKEVSSSDPDFVLKCRMIRYRLTPLDVGGGVDCFFKSVSHQLCGDSSHHLELRATGVRYLTDNPERFIESNTETSWLQYLSRMSMQGTWADNIVIQAVADSMNLKIYIIESDDNSRDVTIVEPANTVENPQSIYIGHIGQVHYVSSCSALCSQNSNEIDKDHFSASVLNDPMEG